MKINFLNVLCRHVFAFKSAKNYINGSFIDADFENYSGEKLSLLDINVVSGDNRFRFTLGICVKKNYDEHWARRIHLSAAVNLNSFLLTEYSCRPSNKMLLSRN